MDIITNLQNGLNALVGASVIKHGMFMFVLLPAYPIARYFWFSYLSYKKVEKDIEDRRHERCA